jgi:hypothetical protein
MKYFLISGLLALLSAFLGCILPFISIFPSIKNPVNLIWGFVYGFGWYVAGTVSDPRDRWAQFFGGVVWPILVMVAIMYSARFLTQVRTTAKSIIILFIFLSISIVLPQHFIAESFLEKIPTYYSILFVVY